MSIICTFFVSIKFNKHSFIDSKNIDWLDTLHLFYVHYFIRKIIKNIEAQLNSNLVFKIFHKISFEKTKIFYDEILDQGKPSTFGVRMGWEI